MIHPRHFEALPLPFVDHDTWRTAITAKGKTTWFAGRPAPGHMPDLRPDGITEIKSERIRSRFIEVDYSKIEERCAAFVLSLSPPSTAEVVADVQRACRLVRQASLSQPKPMPTLSPRTEYTVYFDGASAQTQPAKYIGTRAGKSTDEPGTYHIYDGERLVAELRFVGRIETAALLPTVAELQAHIEALEKDALDVVRTAGRLNRIADLAEAASFGNRTSTLERILEIALDD